MPVEPGVLGSFTEPSSAARAVRALKTGGFADVRVAMPAPFPEVVAAVGKPRSPIDFFTFPGALVGLLCGIALTVGTSMAWPLVTGGKPIVSVPPFVIVIFEVTVLIGSLTNLLAVSVGSWHGGRARVFPAHRRFNADRIGVYAVGGEAALAERLLRESGAEEVGRVG
jgi:molybdopterin-containing oxidoreductase family membrane subunit